MGEARSRRGLVCCGTGQPSAKPSLLIQSHLYTPASSLHLHLLQERGVCLCEGQELGAVELKKLRVRGVGRRGRERPRRGEGGRLEKGGRRKGPRLRLRLRDLHPFCRRGEGVTLSDSLRDGLLLTTFTHGIKLIPTEEKLITFHLKLYQSNKFHSHRESTAKADNFLPKVYTPQ